MRAFFAFFISLWAAQAAAHPHVFVQTQLVLLPDAQGRVATIEVHWAYDELTSLMTLEDMGLDQDYDGVLSPGELARLQGFDLRWIAGFEGDLYLAQGGQAVQLDAPVAVETRFENGQIISVHRRAFAPVPAGTVLEIKAYDPTFYTEYTLAAAVQVPDGCRVQVLQADLGQANALLDKLLQESPDMDDDAFPAVGHAFADKVTVTCAQ